MLTTIYNLIGWFFYRKPFILYVSVCLTNKIFCYDSQSFWVGIIRIKKDLHSKLDYRGFVVSQIHRVVKNSFTLRHSSGVNFIPLPPPAPRSLIQKCPPLEVCVRLPTPGQAGVNLLFPTTSVQDIMYVSHVPPHTSSCDNRVDEGSSNIC